ncbi:MAG: radical SAM protein [Candidatus Omnitrophica bacterium]|nr:radical SAM protein [Candidatus Omnitrophota bacterium]MBU0878940.1 radical SAM protein [Candidatus Omnitrophota bacterium]MBU0897241.1 radical SAM protein [Candidatus Omnitrophota bacterium]MBU1133945.1 radical SAM protein [Candidatus Omnitrophota bacterium]MBU1809716.1 radical SAM protein [Candidatus Omnitrophota bacterium]
MNNEFTKSLPLSKFSIWDKFKSGRKLVSFNLEITARCNSNCRHCYINLPANDKKTSAKELSFNQIKKIVDEAIELGALWCLLTGGEPLLREDFFDLYLSIKKKGLLVSVFTNATLITQKHIELFKRYPPRDIEVTVYGVTKDTYERVTRIPGSFDAFMWGLNLLLGNGIRTRFKAMALRSNVKELSQIAQFCRKHTKDYFRFDPFLHLRFDHNQERNKEIKSERLSPQEIVTIEKADSRRFGALKKGCDKLIMPEAQRINCNHLFHCGIGNGSFTVSCDGYFRLCSSLWHTDCIYDLKKGTLKEAWENFVPKVREMRSDNKNFLEKCRKCPIINLCIWCPAHSHLETGEIDKPVDYFCEVAHARADALQKV